MAKLSAHGIELLRMYIVVLPEAHRLTDRDKTTVAYMSDGAILTKIDVHFVPDRFEPEGRNYSYGWKKYSKYKADEKYAERLRNIKTQLIEKGWTVETDRIPMLLIPMDGPDSIPCIVRCFRCRRHEHSPKAYADIKGEPFKSFYCASCTATLNGQSNVVVMTREEFCALIENAHA